MPLDIGHVLLRLQGRVAENGLGSGAGCGPEEGVRAEPRSSDGQHVRTGQGLVHSVNVVPRDASALITEELPGREDGQ